MKWLKSSTAKSWVINGKIVPGNTGSNYLVLEEEEYQTLKASFAVKSLLKTNAILVLEEEPGELKNTVPVLQESNRELEDKLWQVQKESAVKDEQLQQAFKERDELKEQAVKELQEKEAEIEKLKKQLAKAQKAAE